ncbi:MAG: hypothetical protein L6Q71_05390 [Planctomycetes bacterium]|nr:hypothetical protein [Planctomycetota bacterium]
MLRQRSGLSWGKLDPMTMRTAKATSILLIAASSVGAYFLFVACAHASQSDPKDAEMIVGLATPSLLVGAVICLLPALIVIDKLQVDTPARKKSVMTTAGCALPTIAILGGLISALGGDFYLLSFAIPMAITIATLLWLKARS